MAKKILKWFGRIFVAAALLSPLVMFGAVYFILWFAFNEEPTPYLPKRDGYWQKRITEKLLINVLDSEVLYEMDTHGGFHGDGTATVVLKTSDSLTEAVAGDSLWHEMPLPKKLSMESIRDQEGKRLADSIENGYYFFMDRFRETGDMFDPSQSGLWNIPNYTLAVYDADENILYYLEVDT